MKPESARANDNFVYHTLGLHKLESILKSDSLFLPLTATNTSEETMGISKLFYMSFARTPASGYIADRSQGLRRVNEAGLIVFDRRLLSQQRGVSFAPVGYYSVDSVGRAMGSSKEAEERLFSDHPMLKGVSKAIVEVRLMIFEGIYPIDKYLRTVYTMLKKKGITVKLFTNDNFQGYLLGRETPSDRARAYGIVRSAPMKPMSTYNGDAYRSSIVRKKRPDYNSSDSMIRLGEYVYKNSLDELSPKARSGLYYLIRGWDTGNPFLNHYRNDLHNMRAGSEKERIRLNNMLVFTKSKSVKQFFDMLLQKWSKIYEQSAS